MRGRPRAQGVLRSADGRVNAPRNEADYRIELARQLDEIRSRLGIGTLSSSGWDLLASVAVELRNASRPCAKCETAAKERSDAVAKERARKYRRENSDKIAETQRAWREANPQRVRDRQRGYGARRRAKVREGMSGMETRAWIAAQPKVCHWCSEQCEADFHVDHIIPLAKSGAHEADNLCISCPRCNLSKGAKDPESFLRNKIAVS